MDLTSECSMVRTSARRYVHYLENTGLLIVEKSQKGQDGKVRNQYRSAFRSVSAMLVEGDLEVDALPNVSKDGKPLKIKLPSKKAKNG